MHAYDGGTTRQEETVLPDLLSLVNIGSVWPKAGGPVSKNSNSSNVVFAFVSQSGEVATVGLCRGSLPGGLPECRRSGGGGSTPLVLAAAAATGVVRPGPYVQVAAAQPRNAQGDNGIVAAAAVPVFGTCGDGECTAADGESPDACPQDCAAKAQNEEQHCGDGVCQGTLGEDCFSCPQGESGKPAHSWCS